MKYLSFILFLALSLGASENKTHPYVDIEYVINDDKDRHKVLFQKLEFISYQNEEIRSILKRIEYKIEEDREFHEQFD